MWKREAGESEPGKELWPGVRGYSNTGLWASEGRQYLEAVTGKEMDSLLEPSGVQPYWLNLSLDLSLLRSAVHLWPPELYNISVLF